MLADGEQRGGSMNEADMMLPVHALHGERVILRTWQASDRPGFAALNADPEVMAQFPAPLSRAESDAMLDCLQGGLVSRGWGVWAVELAASGQLIGCIGLNPVQADMPFAPAVEVLWRLIRPAWGQGLAQEAAQLAIRTGFDRLALPHIVAFTACSNLRSQALMQRLGMVHRGEFDHPALAEESCLRRHVWYQLDAPE